MAPGEVANVVSAYVERFPEDRAALQPLRTQLANEERLDDRKNFNGHITGAGIVLSPNRQRVLLIHHITFDRWLQPGGHWESDEPTPLAAAKREVHEETGLSALRYVPVDSENVQVPLALSVHKIAANPKKREPAHYHYDFRYVFITAEEALMPQLSEVHAARWFALDAPETVEIAVALSRLDLVKAA